MLFAVSSDKGSPGATTTALALAAAWPTPATVVEADPYGGDLVIRLCTSRGDALPETPTVLTLATAARTRSEPLLARYAQRLNDHVSVVPGHLVAEQALGVTDWQPLGDALAVEPRPVLADLGRLHSGSPVLPIAAAAVVVLVVARADPASVIRLRERLSRLVPALAARRTAPVRVWPVLVTQARHGHRDVEDLHRLLAETAAGPLIEGIGHVAIDPDAVVRLEAGEHPNGWLARSNLMRTARAVATDLAALNQVVVVR
jgi:hypothetical protein